MKPDDPAYWMSWTCEHCATRHESEGAIRACHRARRGAKRLAFLILMGLVVAFFTIALVINQVIYGDWRCAFAKCRIVEVKEKSNVP